MTRLRVQMLGGYTIQGDGALLLAGRRNSRLALLLAYMLLCRGRRQSREHLAFTFWADSNERQARTNLRGLLDALRRQAPELAACLQDEEYHLCWRFDPEQRIDVFDFVETVQRAEAVRTQDPGHALDLLRQAVAQYAGELLPGYSEDWVLAERHRLHSLYLDALTWLVEALEASRQAREAIRWAETLTQADPLREQSHLLLMRLLAAAGDRARALAVYAVCARTLTQELGIEPGLHIETLYRRLLTESVVDLAARASSAPPVVLVGRRQEWHRLFTSWRRAAAGNPHVVTLVGEAGIGKTRLARHLVDQCAREGGIALTASCPQAKQPVAYLALTGWLASPKLARRIESLGEEEAAHLQVLSPVLRRRHPNLRPPSLLAPHWQRLHLHRALAATLIDPDVPMLLFLDDAQWCDNESLDWLHYLLLTRQNARVLIILSVRTGEQEDQPFALVRTELLARGWMEQIDMGRLTHQETLQLARQVMASPLDAAQGDWLFAVSAGVPFFIIELARMLADASVYGAPAPLPSLKTHTTLPITVSALILHRLASLSAAARQLLDSAAVISGRFAGAVLCSIDRLADNARVAALDELCRRALLVRLEGDLYEFDHELIREVVYQQLSAVRRQHLHAQAADALAALYAEDLISHAAQIAWHLEHAGRLLEAAQLDGT